MGTGEARTWNDLARIIFSALGMKPCIEYIGMPESLKSKYQYFTEAKMDKLRTIGYQRSCMSLADAVKTYAGYLKTNAHL